MAADDLARELQGHEDCDTEGIYQDVDKLRQVISRTDDEAGSYFCFGDEFSQLSEEDAEPELSDDEEGEEEDAGGTEGGDKVKLLKKCLRQNKRFQEMVRVRLALVTVHLKDVQEKMDNLEGLKSNAETSSRVKNSLCLSSFLNSPYFVDDKGGTPPPNADVKMNLRSDPFLTYNKLKNYRLFSDKDKPPKTNKDRERLQHTVVQMCLEQLMVPLYQQEKESQDKRKKEAINRQLNEMEGLTPREVVQRASINEVNWDKVSMVTFGGDRPGSECCQLWHSAASPLLNMDHWGKAEDKRLLELARVHGNRNWEKIAAELETSRSPVQCLLRYQTFLNFEIHKGAWSPEEDHKLAELVERFGARNWALIASELSGRTANQCLQRWTRGVSKAFGTTRKRKWTTEEDELLERAVSSHGQQWVKVAKMVKTRNDRQCRERWVNVLSPDVNRLDWSEEEGRRLCLLCKKHETAGTIRWSAVAKEMPGRTDAQCRRHYLTFQSHPTEAVNYVRRNKKQLLIAQRHGGMGRKAQDKLSGQITELAGEDIDDNLMPDKEQAKLQRFMDRTLLPPVCGADHMTVPPVSKPLPDVTDSPEIISTLPPYNVDSGWYGPYNLLALQFSNSQLQPPTVGLASEIPGNADPTQVQHALSSSHRIPLSGEGRRKRRRRRTVVKSSLSQVRMQTLMVYQEFPPITSPPRPYSPLVGAFLPEFCPLRGTRVAPPDTPTPHFLPPALQHQVGSTRPVLTQFYAVTDPTSHPLPSQQPSNSGVMGIASSGTASQQKYSRSTSIFAAPCETQARLSSMASTYSPALGGFVAMPHANDTQCFYSPYSIEMPLPVSATQQPYFESSTKAVNEDIQTRESGMDQILSEVAPVFGLPFNPPIGSLVEREGEASQPTSLSPPTLQTPVTTCEATSVAASNGGIGKGKGGERRRSALSPPAEAHTFKQARISEPLSRASHGVQQEHGTSSVIHQRQESSAEVALSAFAKRRTRSDLVSQLPRLAGAGVTGGPSNSGNARELEEGVDIVDALRRCSFPSTQFSTLLQAMQVNTPLQAGGMFTRTPQKTPLLPPSHVTIAAFKRLQEYVNANRKGLPTSFHSQAATSEDRPQLLLWQRFNSLFAWPALTSISSEQANPEASTTEDTTRE